MNQDSKQPLLSIITCTYNAAQTLSPTLESVECQSFGDFEHVIIDGQSSDSTMEIAAQYAERMTRRGRQVVSKSEPDGGLYYAMNKALDMARGQFLVFLNAGDRLHSADTLTEVAKVARQNESGVIYGQTDIVDEQGQFKCHRRLVAPEKLSWRSFRWGMLVCHQAFYARRDIAVSLPYDTTLRFSADVDWCIRVMRESERRGLKLSYTNSVVADFMDGGMTTVNHKKSLRERFRVMCRHYGIASTVLCHLWFVVRAVVKK